MLAITGIVKNTKTGDIFNIFSLIEEVNKDSKKTYFFIGHKITKEEVKGYKCEKIPIEDVETYTALNTIGGSRDQIFLEYAAFDKINMNFPPDPRAARLKEKREKGQVT